MSEVRNELLNAILSYNSNKQKTVLFGKDSSEPESKFRHRMLFEIANFPDDEWELLSETAQQWFNNAVICHNHKRPLPPFPDERVVIPNPLDLQKKESKKPAKSKGKGRKLRDDMIIRLKVSENPKRPNTLAWRKFALLKDGMSVIQYKQVAQQHPELGYANKQSTNWVSEELRHCIKKGFIEVEEPE